MVVLTGKGWVLWQAWLGSFRKGWYLWQAWLGSFRRDNYPCFWSRLRDYIYYFDNSYHFILGKKKKLQVESQMENFSTWLSRHLKLCVTDQKKLLSNAAGDLPFLPSLWGLLFQGWESLPLHLHLRGWPTHPVWSTPDVSFISPLALGPETCFTWAGLGLPFGGW